MSNGIIEDINIINYKEFINIEGHYGGYQNWLYSEKLRKKFWADRSCGIVAAGNIAYYLTRNHNKKLYNEFDLSIRSFTKHLNEVYKFIRPRVYGIPTIYHMEKGFVRFAKFKGVNLKPQKINMNMPKDKIVKFIKDALKDDYPIMMLTWNTKILNLKNHWVTITGYSKDINGNRFIKTSNWGREEIFNLDSWLDSRGIYKGLIFFK